MRASDSSYSQNSIDEIEGDFLEETMTCMSCVGSVAFFEFVYRLFNRLDFLHQILILFPFFILGKIIKKASGGQVEDQKFNYKTRGLQKVKKVQCT
jgi:hypothetical protein